MHPRLEDFISYAKSKGIIETLINTNATHLTSERAESLINSGLDVLIYSFDGGSKTSYEKNRPGRFKTNPFESVLDNIHQFAHVRSRLSSPLPFTKIQMILTEDTFSEQDSFFTLFNDYVDSVTVTQYSERGGNIQDLTTEDQIAVRNRASELGIDDPSSLSYLKQPDGSLLISHKRSPCQQPFQRLLVTYDGRVSMCCYDWGAKYTVGLLDDISHLDPNYDKLPIMEKSRSSSHGFKDLKDIKLPEQYTDLKYQPTTLESAWNSASIQSARRSHITGSDLPEICTDCSFKDTYKWI